MAKASLYDILHTERNSNIWMDHGWMDEWMNVKVQERKETFVSLAYGLYRTFITQTRNK